MQYRSKKMLVTYLCVFILTFCLLYFGTIAFIGITAPGGRYSFFLDHYLNYVAWLRKLLIQTAALFLRATGYNIITPDTFTIRVAGGRGTRIVYSCLGYGVMSFWAAFIIANKGAFLKKVIWVFVGLVAIFVINVLRISLLVMSVNGKPDKRIFAINHHLFFNIVAYIFIFFMIWLYDHNNKVKHNN